MRNIFKMILNLISSIELMHKTIYQKVMNTAVVILHKTRRFPGIVQYNGLGSLKLLREVSEILDSLELVYFIVGGFAYDIKSCRLSRTHKDIDIAVLQEGDFNIVSERFKEHGYTVIQGPGLHFNKHGRNVDLFLWQRKDDNSVVMRQTDAVVCMPMDYFKYDIRSLWGYQYKVACDEYIACIEPFVKNPESLDYVRLLKQNLSKVSCKLYYEETHYDIAIYDYCSNSLPGKRKSESG